MRYLSDKIIKAAKAALGACLAILLAQLLGLSYTPAAGVITLLSLQETKKETLTTAFQRLIAFITATAISWASFTLLGYNLWAFGVYLLFFVTFCHWFSMSNAIGMCSVLITHYLIEQSMSPAWLANELLLLVIGAGIGIGINLFLPVGIRRIRLSQQEIDDVIRDVLKAMADLLEGKQDAAISEKLDLLNEKLKLARKQAERAKGNALTLDVGYYSEYIDMRRNQYLLLKRMVEDFTRLSCIPVQAEGVIALLRRTAETFHEFNNAQPLLDFADEIRQGFRAASLPESRDEFEARATLLHIFDELEYFLFLKVTFSNELTPEQKNEYWGKSV